MIYASPARQFCHVDNSSTRLNNPILAAKVRPRLDLTNLGTWADMIGHREGPAVFTSDTVMKVNWRSPKACKTMDHPTVQDFLIGVALWLESPRRLCRFTLACHLIASIPLPQAMRVVSQTHGFELLKPSATACYLASSCVLRYSNLKTLHNLAAYFKPILDDPVAAFFDKTTAHRHDDSRIANRSKPCGNNA